uniref:Uncharacterized protein n=1 Tax=Hyaloperonospora arabidopsidis (strain Emoy2) TaxID=559515 RepID=M4BJ48_HYAAE
MNKLVEIVYCLGLRPRVIVPGQTSTKDPNQLVQNTCVTYRGALVQNTCVYHMI